MDWLNLIIGICLLIIGIVWLNHQVVETKKYKKEESFGQLSTQPSQYIGILILILGGFLIAIRAL
jgi:hypothetical protein